MEDLEEEEEEALVMDRVAAVEEEAGVAEEGAADHRVTQMMHGAPMDGEPTAIPAPLPRMKITAQEYSTPAPSLSG